LKRRRRGSGLGGRPESNERPRAGDAAPKELVVFEHERRFWVRLADGPQTGLFLDQRDNRSLVERESFSRSVLNLFCYTGSFSVSAGRGGARKVTSVDSSRAALSRLDGNLRLNGLDPAQHRLLRADAVDWLARAARRTERFDFIVLDPPTFSRDVDRSFHAPSRYEDLVVGCLQLLDSGGRLLAVTNHRGTSPTDFLALVERAAQRSGRRESEALVLPSPLDCRPRRNVDPATKSVLLSLD
jgi:23S rRNA (cytosine1962-C5)-methyltransferase